MALYHVREESCRRFFHSLFFFFSLVLNPRGYKEEKKAGDGGRLGDWKMPGSHSTTASNPFLTPQHQRERGERENREHTHAHTYTHTHTHGVCSIYSKASRALARCTKRKLSCRPEINYRVSRGWIRKGWFLCCNNALRAANLRKYHLDSFGFGQREREREREFFQLCRIYNVIPFFGYISCLSLFSRGWCLKG